MQSLSVGLAPGCRSIRCHARRQLNLLVGDHRRGPSLIFMQAGFAFVVETGFCRAKEAAHVVSTNFAVFSSRFPSASSFIGFPLSLSGWMLCATSAAQIGAAVAAPHFLAMDKWIFCSRASVGIVRRRDRRRASSPWFYHWSLFMETTATIRPGRRPSGWKWAAS